MEVSFICQCGRRFLVPKGRYQCATCGVVHFHRTSIEEHEKRQRRIERVARARTAGAKSRRISAAVRRRSKPGEGYGTALDRFEQLAIRFNSPLAAELTLLLHICACDRSVAIATLNTSDQP